MRVQVIACFIIGVCCIVPFAATQGPCLTPDCYDCTQCEVDCTTLRKACDSDAVAAARVSLCDLENANCKAVHGCNVPSASIEIYPAALYSTTNPTWVPKTVVMRPNCCYNLNNPAWQPWYDNTLSSLKTGGACVKLFDGLDCTGTSLTVDSTWTAAQLAWIDDVSRTGPPTNGILFNDKASSMKLC